MRTMFNILKQFVIFLTLGAFTFPANKDTDMKSEDIYNIGDLINFLRQFDPQKRVMIYDSEYGQDNPLQHIDIKDDRIIMYD